MCLTFSQNVHVMLAMAIIVSLCTSDTVNVLLPCHIIFKLCLFQYDWNDSGKQVVKSLWNHVLFPCHQLKGKHGLLVNTAFRRAIFFLLCLQKSHGFRASPHFLWWPLYVPSLMFRNDIEHYLFTIVDWDHILCSNCCINQFINFIAASFFLSE